MRYIVIKAQEAFIEKIFVTFSKKLARNAMIDNIHTTLSDMGYDSDDIYNFADLFGEDDRKVFYLDDGCIAWQIIEMTEDELI